MNRSPMPHRRGLILLLACLLLPCLCAAEPEENKQMNIISIGKLRQEISSHQEKVEKTSKEEHSLLDELAALDNKIGQQKAKVEVLQTRLREQEQILKSKEQELTTITEKNEVLRQHLINRLRSFYLLGRTGFLNIVFSNKTLPDLMLASDALRSLVTYDQAVFAEYRKSIIEIDRVKRAQELEKSIQEHFLADADTEKSLLQQVANEKNAVLQRIQTEKGLYEQAIREMKKAESALLAALPKSSPTPELNAFGFIAQKKKLPPPVWGKVVRRFQEPTATEEDTAFANGITIETPDQAEVFAVYDGIVIFSGYMRGYGKMVIIEHDQHYYTVTARFDDTRVLEGDSVQQNQVIGTTGESSALFGQGLYFEIRRDAQPENPLDWIQPGTLATR